MRNAAKIEDSNGSIQSSLCCFYHRDSQHVKFSVKSIHIHKKKVGEMVGYNNEIECNDEDI